VLCGLPDAVKGCPKLIIAADFAVRFALIGENYRKKDQIQLLRGPSLGTDLQAVLAGAAV